MHLNLTIVIEFKFRLFKTQDSVRVISAQNIFTIKYDDNDIPCQDIQQGCMR